MTTTVTLSTPGAPTPFATNYFFSPRASGAAWDWIRRVIAANWNCSEEAVGCLEDADQVTVDGEPVASFCICVDNTQH